MAKIIHKLHPKNWFKQANEETLTPQSSVKLFFLELIKLMVFAVVTIFLVRYFLFKPFYVRGASMEPNFFEKEYLIIDEISYRLHEPVRGDIIVFKYPLNEKEFFLKRIIGLPNEKLSIKDGRVIVYNNEHPEGFILEEDYLPKGLVTTPDVSTVLKADEYFVMGDNRFSSFDSRGFGPIKKPLIVGKVLVRGWPFNRVKFFVGQEKDSSL